MLILTSDLELVELRIKIQFLSVCTPDFFCGHEKIETCLVTEHEHEPEYEGSLVYC